MDGRNLEDKSSYEFRGYYKNKSPPKFRVAKLKRVKEFFSCSNFTLLSFERNLVRDIPFVFLKRLLRAEMDPSVLYGGKVSKSISFFITHSYARANPIGNFRVGPREVSVSLRFYRGFDPGPG